jgi:23S rRNA pseudouridine1911/1915/1917 synthase
MSDGEKRTLDRDVAFDVPKEGAAKLLDAVLRAHLGMSWGAVRELIKRGKVVVDGERVIDATRRMREGAHVEVHPHARRLETHPGGTLEKDAIVFLDTHVVVVRKPAGISTIPYDDEEAATSATLEDRVHRHLVRHARQAANASLGVVHRIDKETSGLVVFARTLAAKKQLANAFRLHVIERRYVAIVHGVMTAARKLESNIVADRGDGLRGTPRDARIGRSAGQHAVTHAAPLAVLSRDAGRDGATLIACRLETGRTHQIRIHLSEAGMPLVGDRVYTRDRLRDGRPLLPAPRMMLHAAVLGFEHPITAQRLRFTDPLPADMTKVIATLAGKPVPVDLDQLPV